ncbi:hypothetical protein [Flammeovirga pacifica]|uniref:Uncharacterized protein n=1 Tax=Flammeovirga pacifica TaxID=915059 RepID=A0A1S1Z0N8_FLAPC|nr:hypothetical protein [Flammeovirga pacifica]OHX66830.1 hypothetical protein NH26_10915 [Flammeovirga pacifica]
MGFLLIYLILINIIGVSIILLEKNGIIPKVKEWGYHILELLGGVILMLPTFYLVKSSKLKKQSYFLISIWTLTVWFFISYIKIEILG